MGILQSAMVVALLLGTLGSGVKENSAYPTSYAYFPGYTRFEENTVIEVSGLGYDEVYYRVRRGDGVSVAGWNRRICNS